MEKTIETMEKELESIKNFQGEKGGARSLRGFLRGANITDEEIEETKEAFNKVRMP